jgi:hypothetical protein
MYSTYVIFIVSIILRRYRNNSFLKNMRGFLAWIVDFRISRVGVRYGSMYGDMASKMAGASLKSAIKPNNLRLNICRNPSTNFFFTY